MNTLNIVREAQAIIADIEGGLLDRIADANRYEDGSMDYEGEGYELEQLERTIQYMIEECDNPTLPSLEKLTRIAREHGLYVPAYGQEV